MINYGLLNTTQQASPQQMMSMADMLKFGQDVSAARGRMELGKLMQQGSQDYNSLGAAMTKAAGPEAGMRVFDPNAREYQQAMTQAMIANANRKAAGPAAGAAKPISAEQAKVAFRFMSGAKDQDSWGRAKAQAVSLYPDMANVIGDEYSEEEKARLLSASEGTFAAKKEDRSAAAELRAMSEEDRNKRKMEMQELLFPSQITKAEADAIKAKVDAGKAGFDEAMQVGRMYQSETAVESARLNMIRDMKAVTSDIPKNMPASGPYAEAIVTQWKKVLDPNSAVMQGEFDSVKANMSTIDKAYNAVNSWREGLTIQADMIDNVRKVINSMEREQQQRINERVKKNQNFAKQYGISPEKLPFSPLQITDDLTPSGTPAQQPAAPSQLLTHPNGTQEVGP